MSFRRTCRFVVAVLLLVGVAVPAVAQNANVQAASALTAAIKGAARPYLIKASSAPSWQLYSNNNGEYLTTNQYLTNSQYIVSHSGVAFAIMEHGGWLTLYKGPGPTINLGKIWSSGMAVDNDQWFTIVSDYGYVGIFKGTPQNNRATRWYAPKPHANSSGQYFMVVQDDGNLVLYKGTGPTDNQGVVWASGTGGSINADTMLTPTFSNTTWVAGTYSDQVASDPSPTTSIGDSMYSINCSSQATTAAIATLSATESHEVTTTQTQSVTSTDGTTMGVNFSFDGSGASISKTVSTSTSNSSGTADSITHTSESSLQTPPGVTVPAKSKIPFVLRIAGSVVKKNWTMPVILDANFTVPAAPGKTFKLSDWLTADQRTFNITGTLTDSQQDQSSIIQYDPQPVSATDCQVGLPQMRMTKTAVIAKGIGKVVAAKKAGQ